jgi:PPP family 3-phenylpropionic acid transporter
MPLSFPLSFALPVRLSAFYFAFFAYSAAYVAYFPLYLAGRGLSASEIALVLALPQVARVFAPTAWGWVADRFGAQRAVIALGCAVTATCFAALPFAQGWGAIALLIAFAGIFFAGALPLVEAITLASLPNDAGRYGPIRVWGSVGFILIVLAGGAWLDLGSIAVLPPSMAVMALIALAVACALPKGTAHPTPAPLAVGLPAGALAVLWAGFCMAVAHGALYAFLTLHLQAEGYGGTLIGVLWTLGVVAEIFVFVFLPALFRRYALSTILVASFALAVARFIAIGWAASHLWILIAAQLMHAATFGSFHAASVAAVYRIFPAAARARGQALFSSVSYGAGGAAGTVLAGWAWQLGGPQATFSLAALAGLLGAYFAYALKRAGL